MYTHRYAPNISERPSLADPFAYSPIHGPANHPHRPTPQQTTSGSLTRPNGRQATPHPESNTQRWDDRAYTWEHQMQYTPQHADEREGAGIPPNAPLLPRPLSSFEQEIEQPYTHLYDQQDTHDTTNDWQSMPVADILSRAHEQGQTRPDSCLSYAPMAVDENIPPTPAPRHTGTAAPANENPFQLRQIADPPRNATPYPDTAWSRSLASRVVPAPILAPTPRRLHRRGNEYTQGHMSYAAPPPPPITHRERTRATSPQTQHRWLPWARHSTQQPPRRPTQPN